MIGQTIDGKYRILRLLGEGGMGAVYEAQNEQTSRKVALKVVSDAGAKRATAVARFQREAKVVGAVDTQHIVQIYDAGSDPTTGCPYIAMELLSGEDVSQLLQRVRPLAPDLALRIAAQACLGLAKAHAAGVIHRDIKPANLFLARRDGGEFIVKILDFGIAKSLTDQSARMTATGAILGSPSYMSPEQVQGSNDIDPRTDIWSLGAVMYETLTGLVPYHRAQTIIALITAICTEPPPPLQDFAKWVPPEIVGVVEGAMQRDLARRFQSALAMHEFIRRLLPGGSWAIHEGMFVPMDSRVLSTVAARRVPTAAISVSDSVVPADSISGVMPAALSGDASPPPRRSSVVPIAAAAAIAIVGAAGVATYKAVTNHRTEITASTPASGGSAAASADIRSARVRITDGASAEVDGAPVIPANGTIEFAGKPGSTHRIRVYLGDREVVAEVAITEQGALPDRVDLPPIPMASASSAPTNPPPSLQAKQPVRSGDSKPADPKPADPKPAPVKPAADDGLAKKFQL